MHVAGDVTFFRKKNTQINFMKRKKSVFYSHEEGKTNQKNPPIIHLKKDARMYNPTQKEQCVQRPHKDKNIDVMQEKESGIHSFK
jgi:hypothetical protein